MAQIMEKRKMEKFIERFETLKARYISMLNWEKSLLAKGESE